MPQPIRKRCQISFTGFAQRPQHAIVVGQIVGESGRLEAIPAWILAFCSGANAPAAIAMFETVINTSTRKQMLLAAAKVSLSEKEFVALTEALKDFQPRYDERNSVVHNVWGHADDHPDKAIWCPANAARAFMTKVAIAGEKAALPALLDLSLQCFTYTVKDLEQVRNRLSAYAGQLGQYWMTLVRAHPAVAAASQSLEPPPKRK